MTRLYFAISFLMAFTYSQLASQSPDFKEGPELDQFYSFGFLTTESQAAWITLEDLKIDRNRSSTTVSYANTLSITQGETTSKLRLKSNGERIIVYKEAPGKVYFATSNLAQKSANLDISLYELQGVSDGGILEPFAHLRFPMFPKEDIASFNLRFSSDGSLVSMVVLYGVKRKKEQHMAIAVFKEKKLLWKNTDILIPKAPPTFRGSVGSISAVDLYKMPAYDFWLTSEGELLTIRYTETLLKKSRVESNIRVGKIFDQAQSYKTHIIDTINIQSLFSEFTEADLWKTTFLDTDDNIVGVSLYGKTHKNVPSGVFMYKIRGNDLSIESTKSIPFPEEIYQNLPKGELTKRSGELNNFQVSYASLSPNGEILIAAEHNDYGIGNGSGRIPSIKGGVIVSNLSPEGEFDQITYVPKYQAAYDSWFLGCFYWKTSQGTFLIYNDHEENAESLEFPQKMLNADNKKHILSVVKISPDGSTGKYTIQPRAFPDKKFWPGEALIVSDKEAILRTARKRKSNHILLKLK